MHRGLRGRNGVRALAWRRRADMVWQRADVASYLRAPRAAL